PLARVLRTPHLHLSFFLFSLYRAHRHLHSFPTRRSSDLIRIRVLGFEVRPDLRVELAGVPHDFLPVVRTQPGVLIHYRDAMMGGDRKSTRLNSSHVKISYAVFCLKKKKTKNKYIMLSATT